MSHDRETAIRQVEGNVRPAAGFDLRAIIGEAWDLGVAAGRQRATEAAVSDQLVRLLEALPGAVADEVCARLAGVPAAPPPPTHDVGVRQAAVLSALSARLGEVVTPPVGDQDVLVAAPWHAFVGPEPGEERNALLFRFHDEPDVVVAVRLPFAATMAELGDLATAAIRDVETTALDMLTARSAARSRLAAAAEALAVTDPPLVPADDSVERLTIALAATLRDGVEIDQAPAVLPGAVGVAVARIRLNDAVVDVEVASHEDQERINRRVANVVELMVAGARGTVPSLNGYESTSGEASVELEPAPVPGDEHTETPAEGSAGE